MPQQLGSVYLNPMLALMATQCETVADELELQALCDADDELSSRDSRITSLNTKD